MYLGIVRDYLKDFWDTWWPVVHKYLVIVWDFLSENVPVLLAKMQELLTNIAYKIYELAPDFFSSVASWFAKLGEKIAEKLPDVLAVIQEYAIIAVNLAVNLINSAVGWVQNMVGRYVRAINLYLIAKIALKVVLWLCLSETTVKIVAVLSVLFVFSIIYYLR